MSFGPFLVGHFRAMDQGILFKTRCYLVGQMQYGDGISWRRRLSSFLRGLGVVPYDPYQKPFVDAYEENESVREALLEKMQDGDFESVAEYMKQVRALDLNLCDRSDFIVAYINPKIPTCGSWEEIFTSNRMKKPIFIAIEGGKKEAPLWLMGTLPHKYIYDSVEDIMNTLTDINSGKISIDSSRWRLLSYEYR